MPQYYNPREKARAMQKLMENIGDTRRTARETGISERTLQRWKHEFSPNTILMADEFQESMEVIARQHYVTIRNNLIDIVHILESKIRENPHEAHLYILDYAR
jgi:transposase-like protein